MSILFGIVVLIALLTAVLAIGTAILSPENRTVAGVIACLSFGIAATAIGVFVLLVGRMS